MKCANASLTALIDTASGLIASLQSTLKRLKCAGAAVEEGILQQYLDEEGLYIKQIPHVSRLTHRIGLLQRLQSPE